MKHLKRDLVMATLFAESEAFKLANRPKVKRRSRRMEDLPGFVQQSHRNARLYVMQARDASFRKRMEDRARRGLPVNGRETG